MSPEVVSLVIAAVGMVLSLAGSAYISGVRWGTVKTRLDMLENAQLGLATRDQLAGVKEDVAEIKGMFRMTLRDPAQ